MTGLTTENVTLITHKASTTGSVEKTMPLLPQRVLDHLRCSVCGGYLNSKPLMARANNQQVCGKCYKILPASEKQHCTRQIGLESLAEMLVFPCRFDSLGCSRTFNWCEERNHESECPYRSLLDTAHKTGVCKPANGMECETERLKAVFEYEVNENNYCNELKNLKYSLRIRGVGDNALAIRNAVGSGAGSNRKDWNNVELLLEGSIFLGSDPEVVYSDIKIKSLTPESIYESLDLDDTQTCSQCKKTLDGATLNHCLQGHLCCAKCKDKMCIQCVHNSEKKSRATCKNYDKGCAEPLRFDQLHRHQVDCVFNDLQCPVPSCTSTGALPWIKLHLRMEHSEKTVFNNELSRKFTNKDDAVIVFCYDNVFRCVYYYFKTFVEFFVTHVGPSDMAEKFTYEVTVRSGDYSLSRKERCSSWNDVLLQKGVTFDKRELLGDNERRLNFETNVRILNS